MRLMSLECKLQQDSWFMHFQVKMPQNGKENTFRDKQTTNKVVLMFFNDKLLTKRQQLYSWTLSTKKQDAVRLKTQK